MQQFDLEQGGRSCRESRIDHRTYMRRLKEAQAAGNNTIEKELVCFYWEGVVYEVSVFHWPEELCILEVESESVDSAIRVPPFLRRALEVGARRDEVSEVQAVEVTLDPHYDTRRIAERGARRGVGELASNSGDVGVESLASADVSMASVGFRWVE